MSAVTWVRPGRNYDPLLKVCNSYVALNHEAYALISAKTKFVDIGLAKDGVIIIKPGDSYTISSYKTGRQRTRGRIGGTGLVKSLVTAGMERGTYKVVYNQKEGQWECYMHKPVGGIKRRRKSKYEY